VTGPGRCIPGRSRAWPSLIDGLVVQPGGSPEAVAIPGALSHRKSRPENNLRLVVWARRGGEAVALWVFPTHPVPLQPNQSVGFEGGAGDNQKTAQAWAEQLDGIASGRLMRRNSIKFNR
jgi:hypothetical protein